jgi:hypothetical protein
MPETETRIRPTWAGEVERLHELLTAQATRSGEPYVTVELSRNAKGETQHTAKVSAPAGHDLHELELYAEQVRAIAVASYERTSMRFPTANGTVTNDQAPVKS